MLSHGRTYEDLLNEPGAARRGRERRFSPASRRDVYRLVVRHPALAPAGVRYSYALLGWEDLLAYVRTRVRPRRMPPGTRYEVQVRRGPGAWRGVREVWP